MRPYKNSFTLFAIASIVALCMSFNTQAQGRIHTVPTIQQGQFADLGGTPQTPTDSLGVSDTTVYIIPITHTNLPFPYMSWQWTKVGAGTATIALTFTQSDDNVNYFPVLKGVGQSSYVKNYSLSATTASEVEFWRDTAVVSARYLKATWITTSTASVKGKLHGRVKANVQ